jgi:predicted enzyme related to lactoylglutathione lyase
MSQSSSSFQGLRTAIYPVSSIEDAKKWYAAAFGVLPYFEEAFYVGFNIGGYELGLVPAEQGSAPGESGVVVYWGVPDAEIARQYLLKQGAREKEGVQDVGGGIRLATVYDPWGNVVGIIENPHFKPERI